MRRLFLALWPQPVERDALVQATAAAVSASGGRAVPALNLHVTLAFLGAVAEARIAALAALAQALAAGSATPAPLCFTHLGHWRRPRILVALTSDAASGPARLALDLRSATAAAGFFPDLKPFQAHVTVAREVGAGGASQLAPVTWRSATLALAESRGTPAGPLYSVLDSWALGKRENMRRES